ncbi:tropinone reductase-like 1 [Amborella trichopoda]|uniref:Secoisolariciresinol dehydrogenase n=1 Tax=Amborella trichopoda TaxID=13333 RepID=U5CSI4_AMBTC|nr:tropinone reductase-like 1 [Amborella trichopoda]ERN16206.1 hypothetical protein AMTR_s00030p00244330 [Amborella trichopoda]|eukprot:XP_006854739.1 tropinone reductase-like 1 [Amborella trichopoda]
MSTPAPSVPNAKRLEGKVGIITGGARGIGEAAVRLFLSHGAKVVIADILDNLGEALCHELGEDVSYIHCDVTNEDDVCKTVDFTVEKYGKLDIMYNNAGIVDSLMPEILNTEKAKFERVLGVNLVGALLGAKHAARVMIPAGKGCILFTASVASEIGGFSSYAYSCSKTAIVGLMKSATAELGRFGIRVNCVSPYGVATHIADGLLPVEAVHFEGLLSKVGNLQGVVLKAEDIAQAAVYLASDDAKYVSGQNLLVDGGYTIVNPSLAMGFSSFLGQA